MSLDAMDWVWTRSTSRGVARLVLLVIADKAVGESCTAYAGTTMLTARAHAARSSVVRAVDALLSAGELAVVEGARGPRGETVYRLPHAVGHARADLDSASPRGPAIGPVADSAPSEDRIPGGSATGPQGYQHRTPTGPTVGPQNASNANTRGEQQRAGVRASTLVPELRALAEALDAAGVVVRWTLGLAEQRDVWQLAHRHGVAALVELAARRTSPGDAPKPARYWAKVWADLDRIAGSTASNVVPLHGARSRAARSADFLAAALDRMEANPS